MPAGSLSVKRTTSSPPVEVPAHVGCQRLVDSVVSNFASLGGSPTTSAPRLMSYLHSLVEQAGSLTQAWSAQSTKPLQSSSTPLPQISAVAQCTAMSLPPPPPLARSVEPPPFA